jgi:hypothetical protein
LHTASLDELAGTVPKRSQIFEAWFLKMLAKLFLRFVQQVYAGAMPDFRKSRRHVLVLACPDREKLIRELHRGLSTINC